MTSRSEFTQRKGGARAAIVRLLGVALLGAWSVGCDRAPDRPSIVLIVVDTLRADRLAAYEPTTTAMPALDRRVPQGRVFTNAFAASSWTLPSVASLFTGRYPVRHGAGYRFRPGRFARLDPQVPTLAESLRDDGYRTAAFVTNVFLTPLFGLDRGFDELVDLSTGSRSETARADEVVDLALTWLEAAEGPPFFLVIHLLDPHLPYDPPEAVRPSSMAEYSGSFSLPIDQSRQLRRGNRRLTRADRDFIRDAYDAEVTWVDRHLDRLFDRLDRLGMLEEDVVVLTSDHGEELWDHGRFEHGHSFLQEVLRVPLVIWGRGVEAGRDDLAMSLVDLLPTLLELAGVAAPEGIEGEPLLRSEARTGERALQAHWNVHGAQQWAVVRWPTKAIRRQNGKRFELFDLESDPGERSNLARQGDPLSRELWRELKRMGSAPKPAADAAVDLDLDERRRLRALGYIE